ncbi:S-ribosylhomocysteine lyase [uncultured Campylobacter sp.]|uniref:S-ribosylhomocysteine lyase n=1 Tax=uncultured Campylobacter sp. TaxID=218934 RepID=UPI00262A3F17|nr:S-ribosylhomocysteine lyase [uncultured Campylobacter sp.]
MPLLESFTIDHTKMPAPSLRLAKTLSTPKGDKISVYDMRFCKPNFKMMPSKGLHTLEHLFAGFMREFLNNVIIIDISPMGCRTGFYMSVIGRPNLEEIKSAWMKSMQSVLATTTIPEANKFQCGSCKMHSLKEAKQIANELLQSEIVLLDSDTLRLDGLRG